MIVGLRDEGLGLKEISGVRTLVRPSYNRVIAKNAIMQKMLWIGFMPLSILMVS